MTDVYSRALIYKEDTNGNFELIFKEKKSEGPFYQIERISNSKDAFIIYDREANMIYWSMLNPKKMKNIINDSKGKDIEIFENLFSIHAKKLVKIKRHEWFKIMENNIAFLTERWGIYLYLWEEKTT